MYSKGLAGQSLPSGDKFQGSGVFKVNGYRGVLLQGLAGLYKGFTWFISRFSGQAEGLYAALESFRLDLHLFTVWGFQILGINTSELRDRGAWEI